MNKINFTSLGCARNLVDTEVMLGLVLKAGYEIVGEIEEADYLVVNTCGFLKSARQEALDTFSEIFENKKPDAKVVAVGCMVQSHKEIIEQNFPKMHAFLGAGDVDKILESLTSIEQSNQLSDAKSYLQQGDVPRLLATPSHFGYLKIAEGCRKKCAFCIIPHIKGRLKSKTMEQVLREFQALRNAGCYEIILIAQDLGDYGKDQKERPTLADLLRMLLKEEGDFWLRLLYLYPDEIDDEIIGLIKSDNRLLPYLDMPIQHINDEMLKSMYRKTSKGKILDIITKLRAQVPHVVIRTSLMVGFPGETEEQFEELLDFVSEYKLDNIGIFKYSLEIESASAGYKNHISEEVKEARMQKLAHAQAKVAEELTNRYIGKQLEVIIEGHHPDSEHLMVGRFYGQAPDVDGQVIINDTLVVDEFGKKYLVEITDAIGYDLIGAAIKPLTMPKKQKRSPLALL